MSPSSEPLRARCLTPAGAGGVAVIELRGSGALALAACLADRQAASGERECDRTSVSAKGLASGRLVLVRLTDAGEFLDEALLVVQDESCVELHVHGSPPLVARVLEVLAARGAEPERRPSAAERSLEEEAWSRLEEAPSEAAARMLLDQAEGALRASLQGLLGAADADDVESLLARGRAAEFLLRAPRVVLRGPVNAGKSTLFNALVGSERALVHAAEGTTRDAVHARAQLGPWAVELFDTAGERAVFGGGGAAVEQAGQELARRLAADADVVVELVPARQAFEHPELLAGSPGVGRVGVGRIEGCGTEGSGNAPLVLLVSRADELPADSTGKLAASGVPAIRAREAPEEARALLARLLPEALGLSPEPWRAGTAVPFAGDQRAALEALAGGDSGPLEALLARGG